MKKSLLCVWMALLCGCANLPAEVTGNQTAVRELILAVPEDRDELLDEVARELARRTEDFAENSLSVELVEVDNVWHAMEQGEADLLICSNQQFLEQAGQQEHTALFAVMEEPYFFRESQCVINGCNHEDILAALNYSLGEEFPMELRRVSYCGSYDLLCDSGETLETVLEEYSVDDLLQQYEEEGLHVSQLWERVLAERILYEVELGEEEIPQGSSVIFSGHRQKLLSIFQSSDTMEQLTDKERAAVEEAIVYSGAYCRTLADAQRKYVLQELEEQSVSIVEWDVDDWYYALQKRHQSHSNETKREFVRLFEDKVERYH